MGKRLIRAGLILAAAASFGCATMEPPPTEPPESGFQMPELINDPIEPFNRAVHGFNDALMRWGIYPLQVGYRAVAPEPARARIQKFGYNLRYPLRLVNTLLQGKWRGATDETGRFVINTTVGLLGFYDPATRLGIETWDEDFGQTFGAWGIRPGFYLVLPVLGPSSGRDAVGRAGDFAANPATYVPGLNPALGFNELSFVIDPYMHAATTEMDLYASLRDLWALDRRRQVEDYALRVEPGKINPRPTLHAILLRPRDEDFMRAGRVGRAAIGATGRELPYHYWLQPEPAPVIYILSGLGGHRFSTMSGALAEMAYEAGFSAVSISSPFNWEFIRQAATVAVPGYTPADSRDLARALAAIHEDLTGRHPDMVGRVGVLGLSMGGLHALFIRAGQMLPDVGEGPRIDRFVAVNPPVDVPHGMAMLDRYFNAPLDWPADQREQRVWDTLYRASLMMRGELPPEVGLPFGPNESKFLIGLAYRRTLVEIIYASQLRHDLGVLTRPLRTMRRQGVYDEIARYGFADYMNAFVVPYLLAEALPGTEIEDLMEQAGLWAIGEDLAGDPSVRVFTNENDFLLIESDLGRMRRIFGERLTVFPDGGHVGNLHRPEVQATVMDAFADLAR